MSVTCQDAIDGHHVTKTLALTLLDAIMRRDRDRAWLGFLSERGFLKHILASLQLEDQALIQSLTSPTQYAHVVVHESRMALLNTIARSRQGAHALLDNGLISKLAQARFVGSRPNVQVAPDDPGDVSRQHRYRLLLFPLLRLVNTLQATLCDSFSLRHFVVAHLDALLAPLSSNSIEPPSELESLQEVHLITSVLCMVAADELVDSDEQVAANYALVQTKIRRALFSALPIYILTEKWTKAASPAAYLEAQRIAANLTHAARQVVLKGLYDNQTQLVFSPKLTEETTHGGEDPPLGILVKELTSLCNNFGRSVSEQVSLSHKLDNIAGLPTLELDLLSADDDTIHEGQDLAQKQALAKKTLESRNQIQKALLAVQHQQLENVLFLLWRHVEYYLTRAPTKTRGILFGTDSIPAVAHSLSPSDLAVFKSGLRSKLNDSLLRRVGDQESQYLKVNDQEADHLKQFIQPLTHRLNKTVELN